MKRCAERTDDTRHRSTPKADSDSETVARSSLDVNQHVQLGSVCTDGKCTNRQIENLVDIVFNFSGELRLLQKDNENLNIAVDHISVCECRCRMSATAGATCHEATPTATKANEPRSCRVVLITGSTAPI